MSVYELHPGWQENECLEATPQRIRDRGGFEQCRWWLRCEKSPGSEYEAGLLDVLDSLDSW